MAEYQMQPSNLPNKEGKKVLFPRLKVYSQVDTDTLVEYISAACSFTPGDIKGAVEAMVQAIGSEMAMGHSVKIEGLGTFVPELKLRKGKERETDDGTEGSKRNATSICVSGIRFKADKRLVRETAKRCTLTRSREKCNRSSTRYTPEERLALAVEYIEAHGLMHIADYSRLTGLLHNAAALELRRWASQPDSGITRHGRGSHVIYIKQPNNP